jgi:uncharacterized protein
MSIITIGDIKRKALQIRRDLKKRGIRIDIMILFGSYAKNKARPDSDIDLALVSRDFGKNRLKEGAKVNSLASTYDCRFEIIPVSLDEYFSKQSISPILYEIKKYGISLF